MEDTVVKHNRLLSGLFYAICWAVSAASGLCALLGVQALLLAFNWPGLVLFVLCAATAVALFYTKDMFRMEYDYTFTNGLLEFARVLGGKRRKELGSMRVANVAACGHVAHAEFRHYLAMRDVKRRNWFLNRGGNLFYFYYIKEGKKHMIVIEPSEEMVEMIRHYLPAGVYRG